MLRLLNLNRAVCLVLEDRVLEAFVDLLCQADLLFWDQLVWQALGLGAFSSVLGEGASEFADAGLPLHGCHASTIGAWLG